MPSSCRQPEQEVSRLFDANPVGAYAGLGDIRQQAVDELLLVGVDVGQYLRQSAKGAPRGRVSFSANRFLLGSADIAPADAEPACLRFCNYI